MEQLLFPGRRDGFRYTGSLEKKHNDEDGKATDGQVDIETPPPGNPFGEGTAEEWSDHSSKSIRNTNQTHQCWPLFWLDTECEDHGAARREASAAQAGDGTSDDEGVRVGRDATDETAELEDSDRQDKGPFQVEVSVGLAP